MTLRSSGTPQTDRPNERDLESGAARAARAWREDHLLFARLLDLLERETLIFHSGATPNYELMLDILHYMSDYLGHTHHPREDVAFERLAQRDSRMAVQVARRMQEHRVINVAGDKLIRSIDDVLNGDIVAREEVELAAATYLVYYRHHLAAEEQLVIPEAVRLLTADDWAAVAAASPAATDPLAAEQADARYPELRRALGGNEARASETVEH